MTPNFVDADFDAMRGGSQDLLAREGSAEADRATSNPKYPNAVEYKYKGALE